MLIKILNVKGFYLTVVNFVLIWDMNYMDFRNISSTDQVVINFTKKKK